MSRSFRLFPKNEKIICNIYSFCIPLLFEMQNVLYCASMASIQQSLCLLCPGLPSLPVTELHQRRHCRWLPRPREPCRPASQGQPQEREPPEQSDWQLSESPQPAGEHAPEERSVCRHCSQEQLAHPDRYHGDRICVTLLQSAGCGYSRAYYSHYSHTVKVIFAARLTSTVQHCD